MGSEIELRGGSVAGGEHVLTPGALGFVAKLAREFEPARRQLLDRRRRRQEEIRQGRLPGFPPETRGIRESDWRAASPPDDLLDRRVEITGPVDRKMIINALNSGANVFMADFEDANSPTWRNVVEGQVNLAEAVRGTLVHVGPEGKRYALNPKRATLMVRPRGWHMVEKHALLDGAPVSASLFDFGLFFFHNAREQVKRGTGPYFYLPKMESAVEARLWNDVFVRAQETVGLPVGTIRATVLIETILAAFEMDEILYELRRHSAGLNCGRWDYIFSFIKKFSHRPDFLLPDRSQITMDRTFLDSYVKLLIKTCHRRGVHALGGMAAQIPIKNDAAASEAALARVRDDKLREVRAGHDGTWVAHPGLIPVAKEIFDRHMKTPHQIAVKREDVRVGAEDLLAIPDGRITEEGLRVNVRVGIQYLEAWLRGVGCVPLYHLMEDAATAEISRSQVWQWARHGARLAEGPAVTPQRVRETIADEVSRMPSGLARLDLASKLFEEMSLAPEFPEFLTLAADQHLD
ncbi:MAG TPA: malate synthase A [Candidatus Polarisedimenticolia bacterium]|nr:malate synthase A [Candidatus Polarisedimenticolia bacterium]